MYKDRHQASLLFGRGYLAGIDYREQRKNSKFLKELVRLRQREQEILAADREVAKEGVDEEEVQQRAKERKDELDEVRKRQEKALEALQETSIGEEASHWSEKPLSAMTQRDWRIFREV